MTRLDSSDHFCWSHFPQYLNYDGFADCYVGLVSGCLQLFETTTADLVTPFLSMCILNPAVTVDQFCSGTGLLESDPGELWDFFGSGSGLGIIFTEAGSWLSKTVWTLFNFFAFCFFPAKILLISWEFWCWMMWFILFFNLSLMVDFHKAVVRWRESHVLQSPLAMAIAYIVRRVSKVGVLSRQARNQHSKSCLMCLCVFSQSLVEIGLANTN